VPLVGDQALGGGIDVQLAASERSRDSVEMSRLQEVGGFLWDGAKLSPRPPPTKCDGDSVTSRHESDADLGVLHTLRRRPMSLGLGEPNQAGLASNDHTRSRRTPWGFADRKSCHGESDAPFA
jgi:hypothetical protein